MNTINKQNNIIEIYIAQQRQASEDRLQLKFALHINFILFFMPNKNKLVRVVYVLFQERVDFLQLMINARLDESDGSDVKSNSSEKSEENGEWNRKGLLHVPFLSYN